MKAYFTLHVDKFPDEVQTMVFLNRMSKGQGKAFAKAWLIKLKNEHVADSDKNWTKIKKAFKATFTLYDAAVQAWVALTLFNQDLKSPLGFDKYVSSSLFFIHFRITDHWLSHPVRIIPSQL